jgi:hypothetical protein
VAPSPLFPGFLQLNNEYFTRRSAQIRLRRQQLAASFSELNQLFIGHSLESFTKMFEVEPADINTGHIIVARTCW